MIKKSWRQRVGGTIQEHNKSHIRQSHGWHHAKQRKTQSDCIKARSKIGMPTFSILIQQSAQGLGAVRQEREIKGTQMGKALFVDVIP